VLQDAAVGADGGQGCSEASAVISKLFLARGSGEHGASAPVATPAGAGRVRNHNVGTGVEAGVPGLGPGIYALAVGVGAILEDVEGGDGAQAHALEDGRAGCPSASV